MTALVTVYRAMEDRHVDIAWIVGAASVMTKLEPGDTVVRVTANGAELAYIRERFTNIRMAMSKTVVWRGDDAAFIADNL